MANDDSLVFPKIPEKNWWILRDQFSKSLPKEVTVGYLKSLLQLSTDSTARNTLGPLKKLGLLDDDNRTTDLANMWRNDEKYSDACEQMLAIYPQELRDLFSSADVDKSRIENWFRDKGRLGDSAARQSAALYLLLLEAEPKSSTEFASTKNPASSGSKKKTSKPKATAPESTGEKPVVEPQPAPSGFAGSNDNVKDWFSLHIDLQIHISPEADAEQIDNIFASMAKHIMSMKRGHNNDEGN
jgi:hypothetical protein